MTGAWKPLFCFLVLVVCADTSFQCARNWTLGEEYPTYTCHADGACECIHSHISMSE